MARSETLGLVRKYESYRERTLNLIPSENILSADVLRALSSPMAGRYAGRPESYGGTEIFHEIWKKCETLASKVFECGHASVAPISGHIAGMLALDTLCNKGDKIAVLSSDVGGYKGYNSAYVPDVLGLQVVYLPFDQQRFNIDTQAALKLIREQKPAAVVLGASVFLFPHPVKEISEEVHSYGGNVIYDGSHVLGLIAGGAFQKPLEEGADLLLGSTHKTFFGPQGGIALSNNELLIKKIEERYLYRFIDNFHLNRVAALGIALEEISKSGREYARRVIENSSSLAQELDGLGLPIVGKAAGFTKSHQVFLDYGSNGKVVRDVLDSNSIVVDSRVRLGTNEVTRRGMGTKEMKEIAHLVKDATLRKNNQTIRKSVLRLVSKYRKVKFTLRD